jgi:hypothetical protein
MNPSKEEIAAADVFEKLQKSNRSITVDGLAYHGIILAAAYRASEARAELLERQYLELQNTYWRVTDKETEELIEKHAREREALE